MYVCKVKYVLIHLYLQLQQTVYSLGLSKQAAHTKGHSNADSRATRSSIVMLMPALSHLRTGVPRS